MGEPFGDVGGEDILFRRHQAGGAAAPSRPASFCALVAIGGEGAFADARAFKPVFREEHEHGHAQGAADGQFPGDGHVPGFEAAVAALGGQGLVALFGADEAQIGHDVADADVKSAALVLFLGQERGRRAPGRECPI